MTASGSHLRPSTALATLERTCDLVVGLGADGRILYVGPEVAGRLGYPVTDLLGAPLEAWLMPINASEVRDALHQPAATTRLRVWRRDGNTWRACNAAVTDLREDPAIGCYVLSGIDEPSPLGSGSGAGEFLGSLSIGLLALTEEGVVTDAFGAAGELLGYPDSASVVGTQPFTDSLVVDPRGSDPQPLTMAAMAAAPMGELSPLTHLRLLRGDGAPIWVDSRWQRGPGRLHVWIREATELFTARAERDGSRQRLHTLLGAAADYVVVYDTQRQVTWCSPAARALLDRIGPADLVFGQGATHPEDRETAANLWRAVVAGGYGASDSATYRIGGPEGPWQVAEVTMTNLVDDPAVAGVVLQARDVTDLDVSREIRRGTQEALMRVLRDPGPVRALEATCLSLERILQPNYPSAAVVIMHPDVGDNGVLTPRKVAGRRLAQRRPSDCPLTLTLDELFGLAASAGDSQDAPGVRVARHPLPAGDAPPFTHAWTVPLLDAHHQPAGVLMVLLEHDDRGPDRAALRALERYAPLAALMITRHLQQARTAESEARFRSVFHDTAVPSALVDTDGRFLVANTALGDLVGCSPDELVGTRVGDLDATDAPTDPRGCCRWRTRTGRDLWIQRTSADVYGPDGIARYRVEHFVDVTVQRTTEDEVRLLNEMLCARITELDATQDRLAAAFRKITQVREDERRALAVQMHDDTVQKLIVASWLLEELHPDSGNPDVATVRECLDGAVEGIRTIIHDLRPPSLDTVGLAATLDHAAHSTLGDDVLVAVVDELDHRLPEDVALLVFRTVGEALRNVRKHSGADHVVIALGQVGDSVVVKVADNGCGFDAQVAFDRARSGHIGVSSMREQILLAGGRFHIGARSDALPGTEVSFSLPQLPSDAVVSGWPTP